MKEFYENEADQVIRNAEQEDLAAEVFSEQPESPEEAAAKAAAAFAGLEGETSQKEDEQEGSPESAAETGTGEEQKDGKKDAPKGGKKDPKDQKIEELEDRLKRNLAEFDNYRKRTEKEKSAMFDMGAKSILEKLLPVIDNFERALSAVPEEASSDGDAKEQESRAEQYAKGMDMIYRQLLKNLEEAGAKPMECVGQPFDPNYHNAVMHVEDDSLGENVVAEEFQKGYLYRDGVLRYSMVKVAN